MTAAGNAFTVRTCVQPESNQKQIGWGKYGLHFTVPKDVKILGGKPDVDYVRYIIKPNNGGPFLNLWFGPYSISMDDQQFLESVDFSQRNLASAKGDVISMDSWGRLSSGLSWRHTAAFGSGAVYRKRRQRIRCSVRPNHKFDLHGRLSSKSHRNDTIAVAAYAWGEAPFPALQF
jgi:hypothetical protein